MTYDRLCRKCGQTKNIELFVKHLQCREGRTHYCKECDSKFVSELRRSNKLKAIEYKGGKCAHCNGVFHPAVYDFHHLDKATKEADPGSLMGRNWKRIAEELDKCILLCANCHRLVHTEED